MSDGEDGLMLCIDLEDGRGQAIVRLLSQSCPDVARGAGYHKPGHDLRYLLAVLPAAAGGRGCVVVATASTLASAARVIDRRAYDFGGSYTLIVVPDAPEISALFSDRVSRFVV